jgi:hypothetical protein
MRFRSKFEWPLLTAAVVWAGLCTAWFIKEPHEAIGWAYLVIGMIWLLLVGVLVLSYFLSGWEIGDAGLVQHVLWSTRTIPWDEITRVGSWSPTNKPMPGCLAVAYSRPGPMSDRGELRIQPVERDALVRALRTRAPQADFEVSPAEV